MNRIRALARTIFLTFIFTVFCFSFFGSVFADVSPFGRTLFVGMSGDDVVQLQKILNSDPATQVSSSGIGSPGQETAYFGGLTQAAVIRFQEKYASDILVPNGLSNGTGIVGLATRAVLARMSASKAVAIKPVPPAVVTNAVVQTDPNQNPNQVGLSKFISAVEKVSEKKGVSPQTVALIEKQIYHDVATTTDLRATFLKLVQEPKVSVVLPSPIGRIFKAIAASMKGVFKVPYATAQTATPVIFKQPIGYTSVPGNTVSFSVNTYSTIPVTYQWKKNGFNLANGGNISGATSTVLVLSNVQAIDAGTYSVTVGNAVGSTTSQGAILGVSTSSNGGSGGSSDSGSGGSTLGTALGVGAGIGIGVGVGAALSSSNSNSSSNSSNSSSNGQSPFGGQLYYSFYCACSGNWLLTIEPLAPNYVTLLTYEEGTQAYLSYNIPFTQYLLGFYEQGAQCQVYAGTACVTIASEGAVSSTVGSSI